MSLDSDRKRLLQRETLKRLSRVMKATDMVTVYLRDDRDRYRHNTYCALIAFNRVEQALSDPLNWDLRSGESMPADLGAGPAGTEQFAYLRRYCEDGIEPLVIDRKFNESQTNYRQRSNYSEISEEFRLFHNLYYDRKTDKYIKIDDEGYEQIVAVVEPNRVKIRLKEIRQFIAIKEMYLSIQFWYYEHVDSSLEAIGMTEHDEKIHCEPTADGNMSWRLAYRNHISKTDRSLSLLSGKRLVKPLPKSQSGFGRFAQEQERKSVDFIIGVDANGDEISDSCDPAKTKHGGYDSGPPYGLIPVHFRKQVLDKYYNEPSKYSVEDSVLYCPWWLMHIDNHHNDKVVVWLCDLFALPYREQEYWRLHNMSPEGGVSETSFRRDILAEFTESDQPEHIFKHRYHELQKVSGKYLGWQILLPLNQGDTHHLKSLRIPSTGEQRSFDELILSLVKILIDSLNKEQLKKLVSAKQEEHLTPGEKERFKQGIGCLEIALNACGVEDAENHISFLRKLQNLRSSGSAHRKGRNYKKLAEEFRIEKQDLRAVFTGILARASEVLDFLLYLVKSGKITPSIIEQNDLERGYAILGEMIGIAESNSTDGAANHDEVIYELDSKP